MLKEKDYCDYETCVALKELGYNQYTSLRSYAGKGGVRLWDFDGEPNYKEGELIALSDMYDIPRDGNEVAAPSLYETQKWLRDEKRIYVMLETPWKTDDGLGWSYICCNKPLTEEDQEVCFASGGFFDSYEEALLEGIKETVKLLKEEK